MIDNFTVEIVKNHVNEVSSIMALPDKNFRKFYKMFTGEKVSDQETSEARLLIVQMLCNTIVNDIQEVIKNENKVQEEYSFFADQK